ncbi:MAG: response regulator transcription factor [Phycisphaerae bacterium]|nr:response regulator transcription factor [Phycisphaerae bacterium]
MNVSGKKILLVDDDPDIVTSITVALSDSGADIHTCRDGTRAVEEFATFAPDLVILDMMLPGRSGFLVLEKIKQRGAKTPRIIMITGNPGSRHKEYAGTLGVDVYLNKPFRMEKLTTAVEQLLTAAPPAPTPPATT